MAKVMINDLDAAATLDGTEIVELEQDGGSVKCTTQDIADLGGGGSSYLKYVALLTQSGTDAPVATVLENTLGGTVVWSYDDVGFYVGTLAGAFSANKTWFSGCANRNSDDFLATGRWGSTDTAFLIVSDFAGDGTDGWESLSFEIRVYP